MHSFSARECLMSSARTELHADDPHVPKRGGLMRWTTIVPGLLMLAAIVALWSTGVLERFNSPERIADVLRSARDAPLGVAYTVLAFVLGSLVLVPITVLIAGTLLVFGAARGFAFALLGMQLAAIVTYAVGRALGARVFDRVTGPRIARFRASLQRNAFAASIGARLLPVGNFTLINALIGSMRVPFFVFFCGSALGAAPGLFVFAFLADRLGR
jgi:phospholipase D1/2